jgi:adsorption protein A
MRIWLIVFALMAAPAAFAQTAAIDLGPGVSTLLRYRVYPHLQRGLQALASGDQKTAIAELEHARRLAPDNAVVAVYLADAYRAFGRIEQARALLQDQLRKTPRETRLRAALAALPPSAEALPKSAETLPKSAATSPPPVAAPRANPVPRPVEAAPPAPVLEERQSADAERLAAYRRRESAYQAYADGKYAEALALWRTQPLNDLPPDDVLGAVTTAIAAGEMIQAAQWLSAYRDRGAPPTHRYWSLTADALFDTDPPRAKEALSQAIALQPAAADYLRLARLESQVQPRLDWLRRAAAIDDQAASTHATLGFAAWNAGHYAEAARAFERAWQIDPHSFLVTAQLVYVHQRLANNDRARWFAEQAIDALAKKPPEAFAAGPSLPERRFAFMRLHEDLGRRLSLSLDGFSGSGTASATSATGPGRAFRSYLQAEADLRLGRPPIRNGSTLSLYARVFADGGAENLALPTTNTTIGAGVRWKPFGNRVLFIMAEGQQSPGSGTRDVVIRGSSSLFSTGQWSDDWHPSGGGWLARNLYLDAAYYAVSNQVALAGDFRMSYHRRLGDQQTIEPYARLQINGFRRARFDRDFRVGIGARWNLWSGERDYDAFRQKLSAGIEFQRAIDTYLPDRSGVFVSIGVRR